MDWELKAALMVIAIAAGLAIGALLGLPDQPRMPQVIILRPDPAAYEIAGLLDEARRITAEAADDAG